MSTLTHKKPKGTVKPKRKKTVSTQTIPTFPHQIWTDGSCLGNPGPAGAAAILIDSTKDLYMDEKISHVGKNSTNNVAELTGLSLALSLAQNHKIKHVSIMTDSQYAIKVVTGQWKPQANKELIKSIQTQINDISKQTQISFQWVKGHNKLKWNEMADKLAKEARNQIQE